MLRILIFFAVVLAAGLGFAWLADHPGNVSIAWLDREVEMSFVTFLAAAAVLVLLVLAALWLVFGVFRAPGRIGHYFSGRNREKGYRALTGGILAAGAGDAQTARRLVHKSQKYLDGRKEPLLRFLDAQTAMIEGDHTRARRAFEAMEQDPDTRLLALRGLFLESERVNDAVAARHYAEQAVRIAPHVPWAGSAVLELKAAEGDYDAALDILKAQKGTRLVSRPESQRLRAVLLTGKAQSLLGTDPAAARAAAQEAAKLAPDLVPATLVAARAAIAAQDPRRALRILEKSWMRAPHPRIAELYVHAWPGESAADRLARAKKLQQMQPNAAEAHLAVAHAALEAKALTLARTEAETAARTQPSESVFLLLADIEEAEGKGEGRVREQMSRALRSPRDPSWIADGQASEEWSAVSPVTGRLDAFEWKSPPHATPALRTIGAPRVSNGFEGGARPSIADLEAQGTDGSPARAPEASESNRAIEARPDEGARKAARFDI